LFGVDLNPEALREIRHRFPDVNAVWALARELPFRDGAFDLAFTTGVLIHQPEDSLGQVMDEIVRVSRRYVLAVEYFAPQTEEVKYRDQRGALFKRDYGRLYAERFPELTLLGHGFLGKDDGWDDVDWWLFEKGRE
jgi:ubiquinone/menaquinone biosynthesis C-methylase UbiE